MRARRQQLADAEAALPQYEAELAAARTHLDEAQTQLSEAKRKYEASLAAYNAIDAVYSQAQAIIDKVREDTVGGELIYEIANKTIQAMFGRSFEDIRSDWSAKRTELDASRRAAFRGGSQLADCRGALRRGCCTA